MKTLLIVEDSYDIAEALQELFLAEGYAVRVANDGKEALALLDEQISDLVLTDVMMPVMDGLELLRTIRADPRLEHVPVIVMSAARPQLPRDPLTTFLGKPVNFDRLLELVAETCGT
jgi:CheY-like chemotaxis protein